MPTGVGAQGISNALVQANMNQEEIANWVDNYRKWRQWNRYHQMVSKGQG